MLNLTQVAVINQETLNELINEGECTSIDDVNFSDAQFGDYSQTALIDEDQKYIIYWNDNIHGNPDDFMDGFTSALQHLDIEYLLEEEVKLENDMKEYKGVTYR